MARISCPSLPFVGCLLLAVTPFLAGCSGKANKYHGVAARIDMVIEAKQKVLVKKYGNLDKVPKEEAKKFHQQVELAANAILAEAAAPIPVTVDETAAKAVAEVMATGKPRIMTLGIFGWKVVYPIRVKAKSQLPSSEYRNNLKMRLYDINQTSLEEVGVELETDARPGEWTQGKIVFEFAKLENLAVMKLMQKRD